MNVDLDYIKAATSNNEGVDLEFKETTGQLSRGMETLCGMINGHGGIVVFGINNKGKIIGQEISDKTTREIGDALGRFDPAVDIQPQYIKLEESGKYLIVFCSNGMESDKPYMWNGKPYQRHDSATSVMPRERFLRLYEVQAGLTYKWERKTNPELKVNTLDEDLIRRVAEGGIRRGRLSEDAKNDSTATLLNRLMLLHNGSLRNSAAILFGKDLSDYPQALIRLARFNGINKMEFVDNKQVKGNIFELASEAMEFFFKHLSLRGSTHQHIERQDDLEIPYDALREAVVNSLCHRAWQQEASTIGIAIYDDRVEIENAGRFPASIRRFKEEESLRNDNTSLPPNPDIANVMFIGGLIEHWGRGLALMTTSCVKAGLPKPQIIDNGFMVKVIFARPLKDRKRTAEEQLKYSRSTVEAQLKTASAGLKRLIINIGDSWLSGQELRNKMGYKSKGSFWKNYLSPAIQSGLIIMEDNESPNSPTQRYGLTKLGYALYMALQKP